MSINVNKLWEHVESYPEVGEKQKEELLVFHTVQFSPFSRFGSIKPILDVISEDTIKDCMMEISRINSIEQDYTEDDETINEEGRFFLHGNMYHEMHRLDSFYTKTWNATPKQKKKRAFF